MRNKLPKKIRKNECGIINLDNDDGPGTHWTAYKRKNDSRTDYFDSFGNLRPPIEAMKYFRSRGPCQIFYNHDTYQTYNSVNCGQLCLYFLSE